MYFYGGDGIALEVFALLNEDGVGLLRHAVVHLQFADRCSNQNEIFIDGDAGGTTVVELALHGQLFVDLG